MKNLVKIISLITFCALFTNLNVLQAADNNYNPKTYIEGDVLKVNAKSGLLLREEPSLNARVFTKMKFGDEVRVLNTLNFDRQQTIELVEGNWVFVEFNGFKGFAFDGFLSDLPLPASTFDLFELIELTYDVIEQTDTIVSGQEKSVSVYDNGFEINSFYGNGGEYKEVKLANTRIAEAYVMCVNTIPQFGEFMKRMRVKRNKKGQIVQYKSSFGMNAITIKEKGDEVIVSYFTEHGC